MNTFHGHFNWGAMFRAILNWITDTTRESRSARLSTLGLSSYDRDGDGFEHRHDGPHFR